MPLSNITGAMLNDRALLQVGGREAKDFLQGLVCNNMDKLETAPTVGHSAIYTGLLTPQGKIMFDFFIIKSGESYFVDCPKDKVDELLKRLMFYRLRAKVDLEKRDDLAVTAGWREDAIIFGEGLADVPLASQKQAFFEDPRFAQLGWRFIVEAGQAIHNDLEHTKEDYKKHRISLAVPEGGKDYAYSTIFPHDACFDLLNGVDFKKGCYVGQEVVSKMHHKAILRKRFALVQGAQDLPVQGSEIKGGESLIGVLGPVIGKQGLSLIRLDRAQKAAEKGNRPEVNGLFVTLRKPVWADYDVAVSAV